MYSHVYNKGVTGGTEGDILGKLLGTRGEPRKSYGCGFLQCAYSTVYSPAKNGLGQRAKIRCHSKPDTRRGGGSGPVILATGREARPVIW